MGISFNLCLEIFVTVNQEEMERFLSGEIPYDTMADAMQMDKAEFVHAYALMMVRLWENNKKKKGTFAEMMDTVTVKMFKTTPGHILKVVA